MSRAPEVSRTFCASLRCQNAHGHVTRALLCEIYTGRNRRPDRYTRFVSACAVEMHMDMSREQFHAQICRENAGRPDRGTRSVRACAVEMHMAGHVVWRFAGMF